MFRIPGPLYEPSPTISTSDLTQSLVHSELAKNEKWSRRCRHSHFEWLASENDKDMGTLCRLNRSRMNLAKGTSAATHDSHISYANYRIRTSPRP